MNPFAIVNLILAISVPAIKLARPALELAKNLASRTASPYDDQFWQFCDAVLTAMEGNPDAGSQVIKLFDELKKFHDGMGKK